MFRDTLTFLFFPLEVLWYFAFELTDNLIKEEFILPYSFISGFSGSCGPIFYVVDRLFIMLWVLKYRITYSYYVKQLFPSVLFSTVLPHNMFMGEKDRKVLIFFYWVDASKNVLEESYFVMQNQHGEKPKHTSHRTYSSTCSTWNERETKENSSWMYVPRTSRAGKDSFHWMWLHFGFLKKSHYGKTDVNVYSKFSENG